MKKDTFGKIANQRTGVMNDMNNKKIDMLTKIEQERPKLPIYEELPDPAKTIVLNEG